MSVYTENDWFGVLLDEKGKTDYLIQVIVLALNLKNVS